MLGASLFRCCNSFETKCSDFGQNKRFFLNLPVLALRPICNARVARIVNGFNF